MVSFFENKIIPAEDPNSAILFQGVDLLVKSSVLFSYFHELKKHSYRAEHLFSTPSSTWWLPSYSGSTSSSLDAYFSTRIYKTSFGKPEKSNDNSSSCVAILFYTCVVQLLYTRVQAGFPNGILLLSVFFASCPPTPTRAEQPLSSLPGGGCKCNTIRTIIDLWKQARDSISTVHGTRV